MIDLTNKVKANDLKPVEGYVFLSDPDGDFVVLVEPDGTIWQADEKTTHYVPDRETGNIIIELGKEFGLVNLQQFEKSWLDGYLPVLQLSSRDGSQQILMFVSNNQLWIKQSQNGSCPKIIVRPDDVSITEACFDEHCGRIRKWWHQWFAPAWRVPQDSPISENTVRACLAQARCAYSGRHPMYGVGFYGRKMHGGFPPTTISMVDCFIDYSLNDEARELFAYYLDKFILPDGRIDYYGPSISEYGQILALGARMPAVTDGKLWLTDYMPKFDAIIAYLEGLITDSKRIYQNSDIRFGLLEGIPEADEAKKVGFYFHNNAWVWRGFIQFAKAVSDIGDSSKAKKLNRLADELAVNLHRAIEASKIHVENIGRVIMPQTGQSSCWPSLTATRESTYTNYRYYPELLETGFLHRADALLLVKIREERGGEYDGMTLFFSEKDSALHLDDWTLASYGKGLMALGERERFLHTLLVHTHMYMTQDTQTAYEQITLGDKTRQPYADWCVPCQLVTPRMLRWLYNGASS